jgi:hypothetical protein
MKTRLSLLCLLLSTALSAASWDGTKGNLTLLTTSYSTGMPGLIVMPNPSTFTLLSIATTDPATTAFRVTIKYQVPNQEPAVAVTFCDRAAGATSATAAFQMDPTLITSVTVDELKTTSSTDFQ